MRTNLLTILISFLTLSSICYSQEKIVDDSGKKPKWVGLTMPETIIVSATAPELMEAKNKCMDLVKQEIINSVAVNITSNSSRTTNQNSFNGHYAAESDYSSEFKTIAANLPFITGISITDAETYWQKVYMKSEKKYYYICHLKYPFSESIKQRLIFDFKKIDSEKEQQLRELQSKTENISSVEDIGTYLIEARALSYYFFDNTRKSEVALLQKKLNDMYSRISVQEIENIPGKYTFSLILDNKNISFSKMPKIESEYATNLSFKKGETSQTYTVNYDYNGCVPEDPNTIVITFNFGNRRHIHSFYFDIAGITPDIKFPGSINIRLKKDSADIVYYNIEMNILVGKDNNFIIEEISLDIKELGQPIKYINKEYTILTQGNNRYSFEGISENIITDNKGILSDGYIKLRNNKNNYVHSIRLQRPYKISKIN